MMTLLQLNEKSTLISVLKKENWSLFEKVKDLETHLLLTRVKLDRISKSKLDDILNSQKSSQDKTSLGFDKSSTASYAFTTSSWFVPQSMKIACLEIKEPKVGKQVKMMSMSKPSDGPRWGPRGPGPGPQKNNFQQVDFQ